MTLKKEYTRKYTKLQFAADKAILAALSFFGVYMNNPSLAGIIGAYGLWSTIQFWIYTSSGNKDFQIAMSHSVPSIILEAAKAGIAMSPGALSIAPSITPTPVTNEAVPVAESSVSPSVVTPKQYNGEE